MNEHDAQLERIVKKIQEIAKKNPLDIVLVCSICQGQGFYYYYDTPTPCDHCNGSGMVRPEPR
jgi:DnaJ-class molecular chaperone